MTNRFDLLRWFKSDHLPMHLQEIVHPIEVIAEELHDRLNKHDLRTIESGRQLEKGLDLLVQAKDCFVRAAVLIQESEKATYPPIRAKSTVDATGVLWMHARGLDNDGKTFCGVQSNLVTEQYNKITCRDCIDAIALET